MGRKCIKFTRICMIVQSEGAFLVGDFCRKRYFDKEYSMENISYFAHEAEMAKAERTQRRLWIASMVLSVALVASNAAWIIKILIR